MPAFGQKMNGIETTSLTFTNSEGLFPVEPEGVNRAALFGDGIFETMVYRNGRIRFSKEHEERLQAGLNQLKIIPSGLSVQILEAYVKQQFPKESQLRIRWNVFRRGLGKYTPLDNSAQDLILIQPLDQPILTKSQAYISKDITIAPSPWSHCKTLNALPYVMANIERKEKGMDDVILLDIHGFVSEAGSANIFWVKENVFYTPSLSCNCIAGVGRRKIIEALQQEGAILEEGRFTVEELLRADQVFTSNVTGVAYIAELGNRSYNTTPIPILELLFV